MPSKNPKVTLEALNRALAATRGERKAAAKLLGISINSLHYTMRIYKAAGVRFQKPWHTAAECEPTAEEIAAATAEFRRIAPRRGFYDNPPAEIPQGVKITQTHRGLHDAT